MCWADLIFKRLQTTVKENSRRLPKILSFTKCGPPTGFTVLYIDENNLETVGVVYTRIVYNLTFAMLPSQVHPA